ncbi:MAG TPA: antibiotic biosynthesis monooxygenase family protein [Candidatus Methylacidiphilales bacterium]
MTKAIHLIAQLRAKPGHEEALGYFLTSVKSVLLREPGCRSVHLYRAEGKGKFFADEFWESREALDAHLKSPQFEETDAVFKTLLLHPVQIDIVDPID